MKKLLPLILALGIMSALARAQKPAETAKEKPAAADTKKAEKKTEAAADKKKETKPAGPSAADKALMAEAKKIADGLTPAQRTKLLDLLNKGEDKAIEAVDGIGEGKRTAITAKRPFAKVEDRAMADGIGIETYKNIVATEKPEVKTEKPRATDKKKEKADKSAKGKEKTEAKP